MLRHDSESSRRLLYSGTVKTWFKAILENRKVSKSFLIRVAGCCFFQKFPPEAKLNHELKTFLKPDSNKTSYHILSIFYHLQILSVLLYGGQKRREPTGTYGNMVLCYIPWAGNMLTRYVWGKWTSSRGHARVYAGTRMYAQARAGRCSYAQVGAGTRG